MKNIIVLLLFVVSSTAFCQPAKEYLQSAIAKHATRDYKGAISDYSKAIFLNPGDSEAYLNRGNCEFQIEEFDAALADFTKTIELNPQHVKAYYSRAVSYATQKKYAEALRDADKVIELDTTTPNCFVLRGQLRATTGNKQGACDDFARAKANGDTNAEQFLTQHCGNQQGFGESLMLDWPDAENWKIGDNQDQGQVQVMDLIHADETIDNWTELGNMTAVRGVIGIAMDTAMKLMFDQAKKNARDARLTFIEKDEKAEFPWIIFTIEAPKFNNDPRPESQLWFIIQGKQALYTNFRALKKSSLPVDLKKKWTKFFKTGKIEKK